MSPREAIWTVSAACHGRDEHDAALGGHSQRAERLGPPVRSFEPIEQLHHLVLGGHVDADEAQLIQHPARAARHAGREDELELK